LERPRPLEQHDVVAAAAQAIEPLVFAVDLQGVGVVGIAADAVHELQAEHAGVEIARAVDVIDRNAHVVEFSDFHAPSYFRNRFEYSLRFSAKPAVSSSSISISWILSAPSSGG